MQHHLCIAGQLIQSAFICYLSDVSLVGNMGLMDGDPILLRLHKLHGTK